jgi:hypothetical protein
MRKRGNGEGCLATRPHVGPLPTSEHTDRHFLHAHVPCLGWFSG